MIFFSQKKPIASTVIFIIITLTILIFFGWQIFRGDYSILTLSKKKQKYSDLVVEYEKNNADLKYYDKRTHALNPDNLDTDVLEEEMRKKMLFTKPNEVIVIEKKE